jgi:tetratricopeptide (TPR) repeat protein
MLLALMAGCATSQYDQEKADVHLNIASAYLGSSQYTSALKELLTAEKFAPKDPRIRYLLGITYFAKDLKKEAMAEFKTALTLKPDYSDVHSFIGTIYINESQWNMAIESFNKALANPLYQTPGVALYNMGRAYYEKGQYREAVKKYEEARLKDPYSVPAYLIAQYTGIAYLASGDMDKAIGYLNQSLSLAPALMTSHYWLGEAYFKSDRRRDAISAFQTYLKDSPDSELAQKAKKRLRDLNVYP